MGRRWLSRNKRHSTAPPGERLSLAPGQGWRDASAWRCWSCAHTVQPIAGRRRAGRCPYCGATEQGEAPAQLDQVARQLRRHPRFRPWPGSTVGALIGAGAGWWAYAVWMAPAIGPGMTVNVVSLGLAVGLGVRLGGRVGRWRCRSVAAVATMLAGAMIVGLPLTLTAPEARDAWLGAPWRGMVVLLAASLAAVLAGDLKPALRA